ncbi:hypothetical protein [Lysinibacillus fusiformis]|uniref:hypothetical protein n=1 Tax=Lysinibacillus fusiformis TaxID=28031 RepID=UPI003819DAD3
MNTTTMDMDFISILPIISLLIYLVPVLFVIWFMTKSISLQKERNNILRNISNKLDK